MANTPGDITLNSRSDGKIEFGIIDDDRLVFSFLLRPSGAEDLAGALLEKAHWARKALSALEEER